MLKYWSRAQAGGIEASDPITNYIDIDNIKVPDNKNKFKAIENRVHSKAWHQETDKLTLLGFMKPCDIRKRAKVYVNMHVSRWKGKVGL